MSEFIAVIKVSPQADCHLFLTFNSAKIDIETVTWSNGEIDMSPDTLYLRGEA